MMPQIILRHLTAVPSCSLFLSVASNKYLYLCFNFYFISKSSGFLSLAGIESACSPVVSALAFALASISFELLANRLNLLGIVEPPYSFRLEKNNSSDFLVILFQEILDNIHIFWIMFRLFQKR